VGGVVIVVLGIGAISGVQYLKYRYSPEYKTYKEAQRLIKEYNEDPYGGNTPEETLQLFIDALKKGDIDLASKYFVMEKWEEINKRFNGLDENQISSMVEKLQRTELTKQENTAFFTLVDKNRVVESELVMIKHRVNKRWKISEL
ncbi:MAG: hypothetical protein Q8Q91_01995, partial [Candidatus Daviesbacteria bacterium]|nr:hypothetical protein [Candidatus Daviesbacteria bacterium]